MNLYHIHATLKAFVIIVEFQRFTFDTYYLRKYFLITQMVYSAKANII